MSESDPGLQTALSDASQRLERYWNSWNSELSPCASGALSPLPSAHSFRSTGSEEPSSSDAEESSENDEFQFDHEMRSAYEVLQLPGPTLLTDLRNVDIIDVACGESSVA